MNSRRLMGLSQGQRARGNYRVGGKAVS